MSIEAGRNPFAQQLSLSTKTAHPAPIIKGKYSWFHLFPLLLINWNFRIVVLVSLVGLPFGLFRAFKALLYSVCCPCLIDWIIILPFRFLELMHLMFYFLGIACMLIMLLHSKISHGY